MLGSGWEKLGGGKAVAGSGARMRQRAVRVALCVLLSVLCFLLICIVVTVPFDRCSNKLPLSQPTSFFLFLSILLPTPAGGGAAEQRVALLLLATAKV